MKTILFLSLFFLSLFESTASEVVNLDDLKWQNRIVICLTNDRELTDSLLQELEANEMEIQDRHIVYFLISPTASLSNSDNSISLEDMGDLIHKYFDNDNRLTVLLIGKDGGVKMKADKLDLEYIFRLIDSMPMRKREMNRK